jgi:hypothetical protein
VVFVVFVFCCVGKVTVGLEGCVGLDFQKPYFFSTNHSLTTPEGLNESVSDFECKHKLFSLKEMLFFILNYYKNNRQIIYNRYIVLCGRTTFNGQVVGVGYLNGRYVISMYAPDIHSSYIGIKSLLWRSRYDPGGK